MEKILQTYLANTLGNPFVQNFRRLEGGWENEVYAFELEHQKGDGLIKEERILRLYPGEDAYGKSQKGYQVLKRLMQAGYPVPKVYAIERENSPFLKPFILMEKINGGNMWPLIFSVPREEGIATAGKFCRLMADLHRLDPLPFQAILSELVSEPAVESPATAVRSELNNYHYYSRQFPVEGIFPILAWLDQHITEAFQPGDGYTPRLSVVHLDFHPENVLVRPNGQAVVIDWTNTRVSDPRLDLAWTLLLLTSYEGAEVRPILYQLYEDAWGSPISGMAFFDVMAAIRRLASILISIQYGAEKLGMRPGAEETMKRQIVPIKRVYEIIVQTTGILIPEVELFLSTGSQAMD